MTRKPPTVSSTSSTISNAIRALRDIFMILDPARFLFFLEVQQPVDAELVITVEASDRGALTWFRVQAPPAPSSEQRIKTPSAAALRGDVQEDETEQHCRHALVLHGPTTIRCVNLPIRNCHHAGQNES